MTERFMWYVPPIHNLYDIRIIKVRVMSEAKGLYLVDSVDGTGGSFRTSKPFLYPTQAQAEQALERNTMEFVAKVYEKLTEQKER